MAFDIPVIEVEYREANCNACGLNKNSRLPLYGKGEKRILLLFDAQEPIQQTLKTYAVGDRFEYVRKLLYQYGIMLERDCWCGSTVQCYSPCTKEVQATHCLPNLTSMLDGIKPELVICFGEFTAKVLLANIIKDGVYLDRVHGLWHNSRRFHCNMMFTYLPTPSAYAREPMQDFIIRRDIQLALISYKFGYVEWKDEAQCVRPVNSREAVLLLQDAISSKVKLHHVIDYETNCLRPYNTDSRLVSCAIADSEDNSYSFLVDDATYPVLCDYMQTQHIFKAAHNTYFERVWSRAKLGAWPVNLKTDTMLLEHVLDNRDVKFLSIKFLAPMLIGCKVWNEHIEGYLKADEAEKVKNGTYALNNIHKIPLRQLLIYNAMDSLVEMRVMKLLLKFLRVYYETFPNEETIQELDIG